VYVARSAATGRRVRGRMPGGSPAEVLSQLHQSGYVTLHVRPVRPWLENEVHLGGMFEERAGSRDRAYFYRQLATMLQAGLPLRSALEAAAPESNRSMHRILPRLQREVAAGSTLHEAVTLFPKYFPNLHAALLRAGEVSGRLDEVVERLARDEEQQVKLETKLRSAMTYPAFVMVAAVCILVFVVLVILPTFVTLFQSLNVQLPWLTKALLYLAAHPVLPLGGLIALALIALAVAQYLASPRGRPGWDAFKLRAPIFGHLVRTLSLARLGRALAGLVRSGYPLLESLETSGEAAGNEVFRRAMIEVRRAVERGEGLAGPMRISGVFPGPMIEMVAVGEQSGQLDRMLDRLAAIYEMEAEGQLESLTSLLEPALVAVMGVVIGVIGAAIYLPIFTLVSHSGQM